MIRSPDGDAPLDQVVLLVLFALLVFTSPFVFWWTDRTSLWYLPYLLWLLVIGAGAWVFSRPGRSDES